MRGTFGISTSEGLIGTHSVCSRSWQTGATSRFSLSPTSVHQSTRSLPSSLRPRFLRFLALAHCSGSSGLSHWPFTITGSVFSTPQQTVGFQYGNVVRLYSPITGLWIRAFSVPLALATYLGPIQTTSPEQKASGVVITKRGTLFCDHCICMLRTPSSRCLNLGGESWLSCWACPARGYE